MGRSPPARGKAAAYSCAKNQAAVEEATSEEAASEEEASLETSDAASEEEASLAASEEALFSSATAEEAEVSDWAEAASEVEAAVEEELPQAVMLTARTRAATVTATFLSFIWKISSYLKIVLREGRTGKALLRKDILVRFRKKSSPFWAKILFAGEILHFCYNFSIKVKDF